MPVFEKVLKRQYKVVQKQITLIFENILDDTLQI